LGDVAYIGSELDEQWLIQPIVSPYFGQEFGVTDSLFPGEVQRSVARSDLDQEEHYDHYCQ